jgi:hypothetical protein
VVTVTRIDRLARSTFDLFAIAKQIVDAKAQFRSLAEPWADTGTSTGRLMIAVLGGLADVERDLIRTRTAEGSSRAQEARAAMGRPSKTHRRAEGRRSGGHIGDPLARDPPSRPHRRTDHRDAKSVRPDGKYPPCLDRHRRGTDRGNCRRRSLPGCRAGAFRGPAGPRAAPARGAIVAVGN